MVRLCHMNRGEPSIYDGGCTMKTTPGSRYPTKQGMNAENSESNARTFFFSSPPAIMNRQLPDRPAEKSCPAAFQTYYSG